MESPDDGSVTLWIGDLKEGGDSAAQHLWERYFQRLVQLACARLSPTRRSGAVEDEEDAALSAFDSFCRGAAAGRFPRLADRDDLWRLLVVITIRKICGQLDRQNARKRGGDRLTGDSDRLGADQITAREPTPELAALVADEYQRLREELGNEALRHVLDLRLEGYTLEEIAARLNCAERTVIRKLDVIRQIWLRGQP